MNLEDLKFTSTDKQPRLLPAPKEPFRGKIIYLYDTRTKETTARPFGRPDNHLGAIED